MKINIISLAALAAFAAAPLAAQASDKEAVQPKKCCCKQRQQVALFVSGNGIGQKPASPMQSVSHAQVGQGTGITFFTGYPQ